MKVLESDAVGNPSKNKLKNSYDLRLNEKRKIVSAVSFYESLETNDDELTETILNPIAELSQPSNIYSIMDIGFDTEFVDINKINKNGKQFICDELLHLNYLVSTQYYIHLMVFNKDFEKSYEINWKDVLLHNEIEISNETTKEDILKNRMYFSDFIHLIFQKGIQKGHLEYLPNKINLIAHFNTADIDKFKDMHNAQYEGEQPFMQHLQTVRKSYSTFFNAKLMVDKRNADYRTILFSIIDTVNLTPLRKKLEDIGIMVAEEFNDESLNKKQLANGVIEEMHLLRKNDIETFVEYAQNDAIIPIRYIDLLRTKLVDIGLNKIKYDLSDWDRLQKQIDQTYKLPNTLTSIGVRILNELIWNNSNQKFYETDVIKKVKQFYGKDYLRDVKNKKLEWWLFLGYRLPYRPKYEEVSKEDKWGEVRGESTYTKLESKRTPFQYVEDKMELIKKTYYGGRNEQFFYGTTSIGKFVDYDLVSAYPSAMMCIGLIDWDNPINYFKDGKPNWDIITDFKNYASFFHIKSFKFPNDVHYPTIPIRNVAKNGIIFPLEGLENNKTENADKGTYINGVEIFLAKQLGAEIELGEGIVFKMDRNFRPYEKFIQHTIKERRKAEKVDNDFGKQFWKEIMNSLYGKTAMGISDKKVFNIAKGRSESLTEDKITSYPIVSIVTSLVRAMLGMVMNNIHSKDEDYFIGNVTTDGFTTNFPNDEKMWKDICKGEIYEMWKEGRERVEGLKQIKNILADEDYKKNIIEEKHSVTQYIGWRTRGQSTLKLSSESSSIINLGADAISEYAVKDEDELNLFETNTKVLKEKIMIALGGQRTPLRDEINSNIQTIWWFCNRFNGLKYNMNYIRGIRSQYENGADATNIEQLRRVSMDFDFKRMPIEESIKDVETNIIDTVDKIKFGFKRRKDNLKKMSSYFTAEFIDVNDIKNNKDILNMERTITIPHFETKPIKNLDEYESIRKSWNSYRKKLGINDIKVNDEFEERLGKEIIFSSNDWYRIIDKVNGKNVVFQKDEEGLEFLNVKVNGLNQNIYYNEIRNDLETHLNNKAIMNTATNIKTFFQFLMKC